MAMYAAKFTTMDTTAIFWMIVCGTFFSEATIPIINEFDTTISITTQVTASTMFAFLSMTRHVSCNLASLSESYFQV